MAEETNRDLLIELRTKVEWVVGTLKEHGGTLTDIAEQGRITNGRIYKLEVWKDGHEEFSKGCVAKVNSFEQWKQRGIGMWLLVSVVFGLVTAAIGYATARSGN